MSWTLVVCVTLQIGAGLLDFGSRFFLWCLVPPGALADALAGRLRRFDGPVLTILVGSASAWLLVQTADFGEAWSAAADPPRIAAVLASTTFGRWWVMHLLMLAALAAAVARRARPAPRLTASALVLASLAFAGHSSLHGGFVEVLHLLVAAVHLLAVGGWLGGLAPLLMVMRAIARPDLQSDAVTTLRRFSPLGHAMVTVAVSSGLALSALVLDGRPFDAAPAYATILLGKICVVSLMIGLALVNRYRLVPRLATAPAAKDWVMRLTVGNVVLGALALTLACILGRTDPVP